MTKDDIKNRLQHAEEQLGIWASEANQLEDEFREAKDKFEYFDDLVDSLTEQLQEFED